MIALPLLSTLVAGLPDELPPTDGFWLPPAHIDLDAIALTGLMAGLYAVTVLEARRQGLTTPVGRGRLAAFTAGILVLLVGSTWPIHELSTCSRCTWCSTCCSCSWRRRCCCGARQAG